MDQDRLEIKKGPWHFSAQGRPAKVLSWGLVVSFTLFLVIVVGLEIVSKGEFLKGLLEKF